MLKHLARSDRGATALEFAIIAPVFFTFLFGTVQVGMAIYNANSVQFALERTARLVMVNQDMTQPQIKSAFATELETYMGQTIPMTYAIDNSGDVPIVQLTASYTHEFVIPFIPTFDVTFSADTRVPLEPD